MTDMEDAVDDKTITAEEEVVAMEATEEDSTGGSY